MTTVTRSVCFRNIERVVNIAGARFYIERAKSVTIQMKKSTVNVNCAASRVMVV